MRKKLLSLTLAAAMILGLAGCGQSRAGDDDFYIEPEEVTTSASDDKVSEGNNGGGSSNLPTGGVKLLQDISDNYTSIKFGMMGKYEEPQYLLEHDHVFEFDASDEAGSVAYDAFSVYLDPDINKQQANFAECKYENGKIYVSPNGAIEVTADGSRNSNEANWGSLSKLYLVQYKDLETGELLDDPIITPFSVKHDLDAPTLVQGVTPENLYELHWEAVPNAVSYRVYENIGSGAYIFECETADTRVNVEQFQKQMESENLSDLFKQDLIAAGYNVDEEGYVLMNQAVSYSDEDGMYVVVAVDAAGKQSGLSNEVDVREVANRLPYQITENVELTTKDPMDAPIYVNVTMVDGSETKMLVNYHGAKGYKFDDKVVIQAHVYNTLFDSFMITMNGLDYDLFKANIEAIHARQDSLNISNGEDKVEITVPQVPSMSETESDREVEEKLNTASTGPSVPTTEAPTTEAPTTEAPTTEAPTTEAPTTEAPTTEAPTTEAPTTEAPTTEAPTTEVPTTEAPTTEAPTTEAKTSAAVPSGDGNAEPGSVEELYYDVAREVESRLTQIPGIEKVLYANNDLEAWLAYCFVTQTEIIPVPLSIYPEAADTEYLQKLFKEAYRQNPTSGIFAETRFSSKFNAFAVTYAQDMETRFAETREELAKAEELAKTFTGSDVEKAVAINNYICANGAYDFDSLSTNVENRTNMPKSYIDAHTPYGILCHNYGVCESYSEAFLLIGRMAGLEVLAEIGTLDGGGHEWNRVKLNGQWYIIDATNNDRDLCQNALLNVSDEQARSVLVNTHEAYIEEHEATDESLEYYKSNNMYADNAEAIRTILGDQLKAGKPAAVRLPDYLDPEEVRDAMRWAITDAGITSAKTFEIGGVIGLSIE